MAIGQFIMIPESLLADGSLLPNAKILFGLIVSRSRERGYCWATNKALGETMNLKADMVSKLVSQLAKACLIDCESVRVEGGLYERRITVLGDTPPLTESTPLVLQSAGGSTTVSIPLVLQSAPPTDHSQHIKDNLTNKGKDKLPAAKAAAPKPPKAIKEPEDLKLAHRFASAIWFQHVKQNAKQELNWEGQKEEPAALKKIIAKLNGLSDRLDKGSDKITLGGFALELPKITQAERNALGNTPTALAIVRDFAWLLNNLAKADAWIAAQYQLTILNSKFTTVLAALRNPTAPKANPADPAPYIYDGKAYEKAALPDHWDGPLFLSLQHNDRLRYEKHLESLGFKRIMPPEGVNRNLYAEWYVKPEPIPA